MRTVMVAMVSAAVPLAVLSAGDEQIIRGVAQEYSLTDYETSLLLAIRVVENGCPGIEFGVGSDIKGHPARRFAGDHTKSLRLQAQWAAGTIVRRYRGSDLDTFAKRYCPPNHKNWAKMVRSVMAKQAKGDANEQPSR